MMTKPLPIRHAAALYVLVMAVGALAAPSFGQPADPGTTQDNLVAFGLRTQGPSLISDTLSEKSGVEITVGEEGQAATLKLLLERGAQNFSLILSSPFDKETERADFFGFDGFNSEAAVKIGYTRQWWPKVNAPSDTTHRDLQGCLAVLEAVKNLDGLVRWRGQWSPGLEAMAKAVRDKPIPSPKQLSDYIADPDKYLGYTEKQLEEEPAKTEAPMWAWLGEREKDFTGASGGACSDDAMYEAYLHLDLKKGLVERRLAAGKKVKFLTLEAETGRETYGFFDPASLQASSTREYPGSAGLTIGWAFLSKDVAAQNKSIAVTAKLENGYKAASSAQVCTPQESPVDNRTVESCTSMALGRPTGVDSTFFGAEYRYLARRIGTGIRAFYRGMDGAKDDFGFEIPLYFLPTEKGELSGGVRLGWSDQTNEAQVTVFAGKSFESLLPKKD